MNARTEIEVARSMLRAARAELGTDARTAAELAACERRLDEPLRVALAGTLKAGKSTLLNALVGEEIAPTDATECTRIVTWFQRSAAPRITLTADGQHRNLPVRRRDGRLQLDLAGVAADRVERLEVGWPSSLLGEYTLVDTPGTSSNSADVSERTLRLLAPEDGRCEADAVVYLMRQLQTADIELLQQVQERMTAGAGPLGILGVLSRADEAEGGRGESLAPARRMSDMLAHAPELRGLHQDFLPVSGLLALRGQTLRQHEFTALRALAALSPDQLDATLISVARFVAPTTDLPVAVEERAHLLDAFGPFGIRVAVAMIRGGIRDAPALADELLRRSGLDELRATLNARFGERNEQLKAHSALQTLRRILLRHRGSGIERLTHRVDRLLADTHAFTELRYLAALHGLRLAAKDRDRLARLLGGHGIAASRRLGLPPDAGRVAQLDAALHAIAYWRAQLENPLLDAPTVAACQAAIRSAEALVTTLAMSSRATGGTQRPGPVAPRPIPQPQPIPQPPRNPAIPQPPRGPARIPRVPQGAARVLPPPGAARVLPPRGPA